MMKVAVDATPLLSKPTGVGLYVLSLLRALAALQDRESFHLEITYKPGLKNWLSGKLAPPESLIGLAPVHAFPMPVRLFNLLLRFPYPPLLHFFEDRFLPESDIYHGTNYEVYPCQHRRRVMNIYDLSFMRFPQFATTVVQGYADQICRCLAWTDLILTISKDAKAEIVTLLGVAPERVWVTPLASRYSGQEGLDLGTAEAMQGLYDFSVPYVLFVSTLEPRKNVARLVQAFNHFKATTGSEHHLVLIGQKGWHYEPILETIQQSPWRQQIHHLDYLPDDWVAYFYRHADAFVYPSLYEGFGLPVLEAMTLGCPVVTSNQSSLPEVAGEAAVLVSPHDPEAIAAGIAQVVCDRTHRTHLIQQGQQQAATFSWERTAKATLAAYRSLL